MKANITLKEGLSYTIGDHKFTTNPTSVTDPGIIELCKSNSLFAVEMVEDKPVAPLKGKKVVAEPETDVADEDDSEASDDAGDDEKATPAKKPIKPLTKKS